MLVAQALDEVRLPLGKIDDPRREALGMKAQPQNGYRRHEQTGRDAFEERPDGAIMGDHVPAPVDRDRGKGLMALEDHVDRAPGRRQRRIVEAPLGKMRRPAGPRREKCGARPPATSGALRPRSGTSRVSASRSTMSRDGRERPVSTKLR